MQAGQPVGVLAYQEAVPQAGERIVWRDRAGKQLRSAEAPQGSSPGTVALAPNEKRDVQALLTPSAKAIAGDYMTTFRANGKGDSSSTDFRITVATSSMWGMVGIGIIAIAFLVLIGAVARFGRR